MEPSLKFWYSTACREHCAERKFHLSNCYIDLINEGFIKRKKVKRLIARIDKYLARGFKF